MKSKPIGSVVGNEYIFACYDERLREAAQAEGLETLPSSAPDKRV